MQVYLAHTDARSISTCAREAALRDTPQDTPRAASIINTLRVDVELLHAQLAVRQERAHSLQSTLLELRHAQQRLQQRRAELVEAAEHASYADHQVGFISIE